MDMISSKESMEAASYLRGFAILGVYTNHFVNEYITVSFKGYAYGLISLFFVLSGYGICISLQHISNRQQGHFLISFFQKRFRRIYPLFWIWCLIHGFSNGPLGFFALDIIDPKSPWFIPAIIQCYLVAPFLFMLFRNLTIKKSLLIMIGAFALLNFFLFTFEAEPFTSIGYKGLFFNHILLFGLGFMLARIDSTKVLPVYLTLLGISLFLFLVLETTQQALVSFPGKNSMVSLLFPFSAFFVCYIFLSGKTYLPLKSVLQVIGKYSYSIYLFHGVGFAILIRIGLLEKQNASLTAIIVVLILTPIFICFYCILEIIIKEFILGERNIKNVMTNTREVIRTFKNPFQQHVSPADYTASAL